MVYLVGVNHMIQHNGAINKTKRDSITKFTRYLKEVIAQRNITLLAEEFSTEALKISRVDRSTAMKLASELGIQHLFCDPTTEERARYGISKSDFETRERFWLERIRTHKNTSILFICGSRHLESFHKLLLSSGFSSKILSDGFGEELDSRDYYLSDDD